MEIRERAVARERKARRRGSQRNAAGVHEHRRPARLAVRAHVRVGVVAEEAPVHDGARRHEGVADGGGAALMAGMMRAKIDGPVSLSRNSAFVQ